MAEDEHSQLNLPQHLGSVMPPGAKGRDGVSRSVRPVQPFSPLTLGLGIPPNYWMPVQACMDVQGFWDELSQLRLSDQNRGKIRYTIPPMRYLPVLMQKIRLLAAGLVRLS